MRWKGRRQSENIEDRRGGARGGGPIGRGMPMPAGRTARRAGGGGLFVLIAVGLFLWLGLGLNPAAVVSMLAGGGGPVVGGAPPIGSGAMPPAGQGANDEMGAFVATVLAETETTWSQIFGQMGGDYDEPTLVMFSGAVPSACGYAQSASGPFYCPRDQKVYLDTAFFQELARRFGAPGDFAQAYVIAHEVGHHVQNELGILDETDRLKRQLDRAQANQVSVRVELQADCLAGIWAHHADRAGLLEKGDVAEALGATRAVGDDTIQRRSQGYVVPESFNHGSAEQRQRWFMTGLETGNLTACDTFSTRSL